MSDKSQQEQAQRMGIADPERGATAWQMQVSVRLDQMEQMLRHLVAQLDRVAGPMPPD